MISFEAARVQFYAHTYNFSIFFQGWQLSNKQQGKRWETVASVPARDSLDSEGGMEWDEFKVLKAVDKTWKACWEHL